MKFSYFFIQKWQAFELFTYKSIVKNHVHGFFFKKKLDIIIIQLNNSQKNNRGRKVNKNNVPHCTHPEKWKISLSVSQDWPKINLSFLIQMWCCVTFLPIIFKLFFCFKKNLVLKTIRHILMYIYVWKMLTILFFMLWSSRILYF